MSRLLGFFGFFAISEFWILFCPKAEEAQQPWDGKREQMKFQICKSRETLQSWLDAMFIQFLINIHMKYILLCMLIFILDIIRQCFLQVSYTIFIIWKLWAEIIYHHHQAETIFVSHTECWIILQSASIFLFHNSIQFLKNMFASYVRCYISILYNSPKRTHWENKA